MTADYRTQFSEAELLLKLGKTDKAFAALRTLASGAGNDLLILNRIGDMLARLKFDAEAVGYYLQVASNYSDTGYVQKAIAIYKKVIRLDADSTESLLRLGQLYIKRKYVAEASVYLLSAADRYHAAEDFRGSREVFQELTAADPSNLAYKARLAKACVDCDDTPQAGEEYISLGELYLAASRLEQAEESFRQAATYLSGRPEPVLKLAQVLKAQQRVEEAISLLEEEAAGPTATPEILGQLLLSYETAGQHQSIEKMMSRPEARQIADQMFLQVFKQDATADILKGRWQRFAPLFDEWASAGYGMRLVSLYKTLIDMESQGFLPALECYASSLGKYGEHADLTKALERLTRTYRELGQEDKAQETLKRLAELAPRSPMVEDGETAHDPAMESTVTETKAVPAVMPAGSMAEVPLSSEAPAVPLNHADRDFVTSRLTQAQILEKYQLADQAFDQVKDVVSRFPGHVQAQEKLVEILRERSDPGALGEGLVGLAMAARAAGELEQAKGAASEAQLNGSLTAEQVQLLAKLELLPAPHSGPAVDIVVEPVPDVESPSPQTSQAEHQPVERAAEPDGDDLLVDFDSFNLGDIGEIDDGEDAETSDPIHTISVDDIDETDDLSSITAALAASEQEEQEESGSQAPESGAEQSIDEVFEEFREHVKREVDSEDFRTHYDLGIGYKEMGLLDEAINQFKLVLASSSLAREASIMLAVCYREHGMLDEAINWYTKAVDATSDDRSGLTELRYNLAETMLESGDQGSALVVFRDVQDDDAGFRDVQSRVTELETLLQS
jgi:pilus assembly protein FimV